MHDFFSNNKKTLPEGMY